MSFDYLAHVVCSILIDSSFQIVHYLMFMGNEDE
jgi:hypothetical protein